MRSNEINKQLKALHNKTIKYNGSEMQIIKHKILHDMVVITTNARTFNFYHHEVESKFFRNISVDDNVLLLEKEAPSSEMMVLKGFESRPENKTIKDKLLEALEKVDADVDYIPKAKAICDIANTMISLHNSELNTIKYLNKGNSNN